MTIYQKIKAIKNLPAPLVSGIAISLFTCASASLHAQDKQEEVTVIAPYNPSVTTAAKINRNPRIEAGEEEKMPEITYEALSRQLDPAVTPEYPTPSRVPADPAGELYRNHLRAGFGNYVTPYFELWVNSLASDEFKAGAHIRHLSSFGQIKDYGKSSFSNSLVEAYGARFLNGHTLHARAGYRHDLIHRYGFKPDEYPQLNLDNKDLRQVYQTIGFQAGIQSTNDDDEAFNYHLDIEGYHLFDRFDSRESNISVEPGISKKTDLFGNNRSQELGLELSMDYYFNQDTLTGSSGGIFSVTPYAKFDLKPYRIYAGIEGAYRLDSASGFHIYPDIRAELGLLDDIIIIYAGLKGGMKRVSFKTLSDENPYVNSILPLEYENEKINFYGGVKGRISVMVDYQLGIGYRSVDMMPLFVNDTANITGNTFTVVYDDAGVFSAEGQIGIRSRSDFGLIFRAGYHSYSTDSETKAWHRPSFIMGMEAYYVIKQKLTLSANMVSMHGMYARSFDSGIQEEVLLDGWFDLGLGAEYRINKQFSAFLELGNLLSDGYFRWQQYPVQKFNAMAGISFSF